MNRFLGIDYGKKRIGLALSDPTGTLASPLRFLDATSFNHVIKELRTLIQEQEISLLVIGIPRNMDGSYGDSAKNAQEFALRLKEALTIPIKTIDERLTTVEASRRLHESGQNTRKQKKKIDSAAAQIILQTYLDSQSLPPI